jgi:hypothetical protein
MVDVLGFSLQYARLVPHLLTKELKAQKFSPSIEMVRILENQRPMHPTRAVTRDESEFFLEYPRSRVWRLKDENAPERVSQKINRVKHMLTVFWSTRGPLVGEWLSGYNTYLCAVIIPRLTSVIFPD